MLVTIWSLTFLPVAIIQHNSCPNYYWNAHSKESQVGNCSGHKYNDCTLYELLCSIYESHLKVATHPSIIVCSQLVGSSMFAVAISVKTERDDN